MTPTSRTGRWIWRATTLLALALLLYVSLAVGPWRLLAGAVIGSTGTTSGPPCPRGRDVPIMASPHVSQADAATVTYNSVPPTSGPHLAFPAAPGIYTDPVPDGLTVHALEHGRVAIQYGPGVARLADLEQVARAHPGKTLLAPYPRLAAGEIALTAWGCVDRFPSWDEQRVVAFVEELSGRYDHGWRRS